MKYGVTKLLNKHKPETPSGKTLRTSFNIAQGPGIDI